jgi:ADP-heptose:LPS heptosyltransferase
LGDRLDTPSVLDLFKDDPTWDDTAAIVQNLDLVITVDTSIAHLAGALGKPTWVMMHTEGSWHWMTKRLDSPWYPTARLFRQDRPHQWNGVVAQVASELSELSKQKAA